MRVIGELKKGSGDENHWLASIDATSSPRGWKQLKQALLAWNQTVDASFAGRDYAEQKVPSDPSPQRWFEAQEYQPYLPAWRNRWEVKSYLNRVERGK